MSGTAYHADGQLYRRSTLFPVNGQRARWTAASGQQLVVERELHKKPSHAERNPGFQIRPAPVAPTSGIHSHCAFVTGAGDRGQYVHLQPDGRADAAQSAGERTEPIDVIRAGANVWDDGWR